MLRRLILPAGVVVFAMLSLLMGAVTVPEDAPLLLAARAGDVAAVRRALDAGSRWHRYPVRGRAAGRVGACS